MAVERDITWNIRHFQGALRCDRNFDVVYRVFRICGREACMFFVDGFAKDEIMEKLLEFFYGIQDEDLLRDAHTFSKSCVPYCEVAISGEEDTIVGQILSGVWAVFVDGMDQCVLIDQRTYPQRTTSEPDQDKSFRGSRDGFVETMVFNAALIRRRIRSPRLCVEHLEVGETSRTDVAVCYFEGRADPELVNTVRERIAQARVDALTMNQESLAELLVRKRWYNPFPKFKFTERPDAAAAQILEGDVVVLVDNSPAAIILPTTLFDVMEEANDYYFPPITGSYLRLVRFFTTFLTTFLTPGVAPADPGAGTGPRVAGVYSDGGAGAGAPSPPAADPGAGHRRAEAGRPQYAQHPDHLLLHDRSHHPGGLRGPVRLVFRRSDAVYGGGGHRQL